MSWRVHEVQTRHNEIRQYQYHLSRRCEWFEESTVVGFKNQFMCIRHLAFRSARSHERPQPEQQSNALSPYRSRVSNRKPRVCAEIIILAETLRHVCDSTAPQSFRAFHRDLVLDHLVVQTGEANDDMP